MNWDCGIDLEGGSNQLVESWAIINGDAESGVTIMNMASEVDAGDILLVRRTPIGPHETARDLHDPEKYAETILFTPPEREGLQRLLDWGLTDLFRQQHPDAEQEHDARHVSDEEDREPESRMAGSKALGRRLRAEKMVRPHPGDQVGLAPLLEIIQHGRIAVCQHGAIARIQHQRLAMLQAAGGTAGSDHRRDAQAAGQDRGV